MVSGLPVGFEWKLAGLEARFGEKIEDDGAGNEGQGDDECADVENPTHLRPPARW